MRIVEVVVRSETTVAGDDNIPALVLALEHGAASICSRAAVVDLHRGLVELLVGNHLSRVRGLVCWSAPIHPTHIGHDYLQSQFSLVSTPR